VNILKFNVMCLIGFQPGYVGYDEDGL